FTKTQSEKMLGWRFSEYSPNEMEGSVFDRLLKIFQELLMYTSGDVREALSWLTELDKEYKLTTPNYGMADFIQDLIDRGYIRQNDEDQPGFSPTAKMELGMRRKALDDIFGQLKKARS